MTVKKAPAKVDGLVRTIQNRTTSARQRHGSDATPKSPPGLKEDVEGGGARDGDITEENSEESSSEDDNKAEADYEEGSGGSDDEDCTKSNQYRLIFPSKRNPEEDYAAYMEYAQKCYDQFTGNYSRKQREEKAAARLAELEKERLEKAALARQRRTIASPQKKPSMARQPSDLERRQSNTATRRSAATETQVASRTAPPILPSQP
jgi:hypothetical protein